MLRPTYAALARSTLRLQAQHAHKPSIRFPDRSKKPDAHDEPHPHPAAPDEVAKDFKHFQEVYSSGPHFHPEKIQAASSSSSGGKESGATADRKLKEGEVSDLHELPKRYWDTPSSHFEEAELEAIMSGGASQF